MDHLLSSRTTDEVIDDHLRLRMKHDIEADIDRNYSPDVVMLTAFGDQSGHDAVRQYHRILVKYVPSDYEIVAKLVRGRFGFIEWRAREPGKSVEDGADSFVMQTIHYTLEEMMPQ